MNFEKLITYNSRKEQILFCLKDVGKTDDILDLEIECERVENTIMSIKLANKRAKYTFKLALLLAPNIAISLKPIIDSMEEELKKFNFILKLIKEELLENKNE